MRVAAILFVILLFPVAASAAVIHVPTDYLTIQEAIQNAGEGDTIEVASGTYNENIDFLGKAITLFSVDGPYTTFIDGGQAGHVVTFQNGEGASSILDGFTVTNGLADNGGGVFCTFYSSPTLRNNIIEGNTAVYYGGGLFCRDAHLPLVDTEFNDNHAYNGGGIYCYLSTLTLTNIVFDSNTATGYGGGAVYSTNYSALTASNCTFTANSGFSGAALYLNDTPSTITGSTFTGNTASYQGGGVFCYNGSTVTLTDNTFTGNSAHYGGGLCILDSDVTLTGGAMTQNSVTGSGGAVACLQGASGQITGVTFETNTAVTRGGAIHMEMASPLIDDNDIGPNSTSNTNTALQGGGISCVNGANATITNNRIKGNGGLGCNLGGGIYIYASSPTIKFNEIGPFDRALLTTGSGFGGGIYAETGSNPIIEENTIVGNAAKSGGGVYLFECGGSIKLNTFGPNNTASDGDGGGLHIFNSDLPVLQNTFMNNNAANGGGMAVSFVPSTKLNPDFNKNVFNGNNATNNGGGIYFEHHENYVPFFEKNRLYLNTAGNLGGGICCTNNPKPKIVNCMIYNNSARRGGGVAAEGGSKPKVKNSVIYKNSAVEVGGGLHSVNSGPVVKNSVFRNNTAPSFAQIRSQGGSGVDLTYCNVQDGAGQTWFNPNDSIDGPGGFVNPEPANLLNADFHLTAASSCINMGNPDTGDVPDDLDGESRPIMGTPDMGVDEFSGDHRLEANKFTISKASGGTIEFTLYGGVTVANRQYLILGTLASTAPGIPLAGTAVLHLNWDFFTEIILNKVNSPFFQNFMGVLDGAGNASATMSIPAGVINDKFKNKTMYFAYLTSPTNFASNPIEVSVKN